MENLAKATYEFARNFVNKAVYEVSFATGIGWNYPDWVVDKDAQTRRMQRRKEDPKWRYRYFREIDSDDL